MNTTYRFEIPVEVSYCVDESNLSIESIKDIKKLEKNYDVDLDFVIDEYEYKSEMEEEASEDEEYVGLTKSEVFDIVINELWNEIVEILNYDVKLNELDDNIINKIYHITSVNFNNAHLEQYFNGKDDFKIVSMKMVEMDKEKSVFYVDVVVNKKLKDNEVIEISKYIDGQCSDGWGEGFEQQDISREIGENERYVYIKTWNNNIDVKLVNFKAN